jgi:3',5'-cyclic AMP phosphodiesterase CpdA
MARALWLTDLHFNFVARRGIDEFLAQVAAQHADWVLIGGDIGEARDLTKYLQVIDDRLPCPVAFVLGNHDFYRGSIASVRGQMTVLCAERPRLHYLTQIAEPIELAPGVGLVGHDGWADARVGNYAESDVMLNDYELIAELRGMSRGARRAKLEALGDEAAAHVRKLLLKSVEQNQETVLLTHVPPLREACWHEGRISDDEWSPHFTCLAVGNAMLEVMSQYPDRRLLVLCGHTHSSGVARPAPNVEILTGSAVYGHPAVQRVFQWR